MEIGSQEVKKWDKSGTRGVFHFLEGLSPVNTWTYRRSGTGTGKHDGVY
jgi:hypothetical protein